MIVDTSAIIAILRDEPEAGRFSDLLQKDPEPQMSVVSYIEAGIVADGARNPVISRQVDEIVRVAGITIVGVTPAQGRAVREAYRDFGRGSGHAARLNFGDCFSYALAMETGEPLLFKGADFAETGVVKAGSV